MGKRRIESMAQDNTLAYPKLYMTGYDGVKDNPMFIQLNEESERNNVGGHEDGTQLLNDTQNRLISHRHQVDEPMIVDNYEPSSTKTTLRMYDGLSLSDI